jgi:cell division protein FtsW (lipid II flippase)
MKKGVPPEVFEWAFTLAATAFLVSQSAAFREAEFVRGAGDRYRKAVELEAPIARDAAGTQRVAQLCARYGGWLPEAERDFTATRTGLCSEDARHAIPATARETIDPSMLAELAKTHESLARSLAQPVKAKLARLDELENRAREARAETDVQGAIEGIAGETSLYREAYGIVGGASAGRSMPLECGWSHFETRFDAPRATDSDRAYALIGLAAILDGNAARASSAASPADEAKPAVWSRQARDAGCVSLGSPREAVTAAATVVATARSSASNAGKSLAAQSLLANVHWVYAAWAAAGLLLLQIGRAGVRGWIYVPFALFTWSVLGWLTQVNLQWISDRAAQTAALLRLGINGPDTFQGLAIVSGLLLLFGVMVRPAGKLPPRQRQTPSSRMGYAGFVLFTGLGWWLLIDLSATGHYANRFHALYQQVYVFAAFVLLTLIAPMRMALADRLGRWFGAFLLVTRPRGAGLRRYLPWLAYIAGAAVVLGAASVTRQSQTQLTSEIFRLWLVFGASWFFLVRGESALALSGGGGAGGMRGMGVVSGFVFLAPLAFVLAVPVIGLVLTDDFGPLFVMLYSASIFLGTAFAFAFFDLAGFKRWLGATVGVLVAGAWVYGITYALYSLPAPLARIAERLATVRNPFTATNDQLAIITWFQESAPAEGYGLGSVPWCGENAVAGCSVPRQVQSDYIFTAFAGVYGKVTALLIVALLAMWLVRLVIHHSRATRGIVALGSPEATQQAWLSWISVCWVGLTLAQLMITVAGNLGWLPLTGITFPFASFGAWSLLANTFFLGLAISLPRRHA